MKSTVLAFIKALSNLTLIYFPHFSFRHSMFQSNETISIHAVSLILSTLAPISCKNSCKLSRKESKPQLFLNLPIYVTGSARFFQAFFFSLNSTCILPNFPLLDHKLPWNSGYLMYFCIFHKIYLIYC